MVVRTTPRPKISDSILAPTCYIHPYTITVYPLFDIPNRQSQPSAATFGTLDTLMSRHHLLLLGDLCPLATLRAMPLSIYPRRDHHQNQTEMRSILTRANCNLLEESRIVGTHRTSKLSNFDASVRAPAESLKLQLGLSQGVAKPAIGNPISKCRNPRRIRTHFDAAF